MSTPRSKKPKKSTNFKKYKLSIKAFKYVPLMYLSTQNVILNQFKGNVCFFLKTMFVQKSKIRWKPCCPLFSCPLWQFCRPMEKMDVAPHIHTRIVGGQLPPPYTAINVLYYMCSVLSRNYNDIIDKITNQ